MATKQHIDNLRSLFEEQKLSPDTTWEQCQQVFAGNSIFKAADDYERITYPLTPLTIGIGRSPTT